VSAYEDAYGPTLLNDDDDDDDDDVSGDTTIKPLHHGRRR